MTAPTPLWFDEPLLPGGPKCPDCRSTESPRLVTWEGVRCDLSAPWHLAEARGQREAPGRGRYFYEARFITGKPGAYEYCSLKFCLPADTGHEHRTFFLAICEIVNSRKHPTQFDGRELPTKRFRCSCGFVGESEEFEGSQHDRSMLGERNSLAREERGGWMHTASASSAGQRPKAVDPGSSPGGSTSSPRIERGTDAEADGVPF